MGNFIYFLNGNFRTEDNSNQNTCWMGWIVGKRQKRKESVSLKMDKFV